MCDVHGMWVTKADAAEWRRAETERRGYVQRAAREVGRYIAQTRAIAADAARSAVTPDQAADLAAEASSRPQAVRDMLAAIWTTTGKAYARRQRRELAPRKFDDWTQIVDFWEDYVRALIASEFVEKVTGIDATTQSAIRRYLTEAVEDGLSVQQMADLLVTGKIPNMDRARALRIARTEVVGASNAGSIAGARSMGIKGLRKKWLVALDGRERREHADAAATTAAEPIALDDKFNVGGSLMDYPGDPAGAASMVINCRCAVGYVTPTFG